MLKPKKVTAVSPDEIAAVSRGRAFKWQFDGKVFDGGWYRIEVLNDQVTSAMNSYRSQAKFHGHPCEIRRADGAIYARTLVEEKFDV
jgi:hypothetical protein